MTTIKEFLRNPVVAFADWKKRRDFKNELKVLMHKRAPGMENGIQFEGCTLENPTPANATILLVLRELVNEDRQFSLVNWPGGIALVRTAGVDNLSKEYQDVNERTNYIIRGGSDKAADLFNNVPRPTGTVKEDGVKNEPPKE
jgi:hypothetical protein